MIHIAQMATLRNMGSMRLSQGFRASGSGLHLTYLLYGGIGSSSRLDVNVYWFAAAANSCCSFVPIGMSSASPSGDVVW